MRLCYTPYVDGRARFSAGLSCSSVHPNDDGTVVKNRFTTADKLEIRRRCVCEKNKTKKEGRKDKRFSKEGRDGKANRRVYKTKRHGHEDKQAIGCICITLPIK